MSFHTESPEQGVARLAHMFGQCCVLCLLVRVGSVTYPGTADSGEGKSPLHICTFSLCAYKGDIPVCGPVAPAPRKFFQFCTGL